MHTEGQTVQTLIRPNFSGLYVQKLCVIRVIFLAHLNSHARASVHSPTFSDIFFSEITWSIKAKFRVELPWEGGTKVYINGQGHMTKMAAPYPYMVKTFRNLLQNQKSFDLETLHAALGNQALQSLYK